MRKLDLGAGWRETTPYFCGEEITAPCVDGHHDWQVMCCEKEEHDIRLLKCKSCSWLKAQFREDDEGG